MSLEIALDDRNILSKVTLNDLKANMSFGFVVHAQAGTCIALREQLVNLFQRNFTYPTLSTYQLYVVHWNDLTEEAKKKIKRNGQQ